VTPSPNSANLERAGEGHGLSEEEIMIVKGN